MGPHWEDIYDNRPVSDEKSAEELYNHTKELVAPQVELEQEIKQQEVKDREKMEAQILNLNSRLAKLDILMEDWNQVVKYILANTTQLEAKLKETIRAVERLAKGKSLGALGLPTEESWQ